DQTEESIISIKPSHKQIFLNICTSHYHAPRPHCWRFFCATVVLNCACVRGRAGGGGNENKLRLQLYKSIPVSI
ncbi:MAG: hypothetical protein MJE68_29580, partial [Proteobacteria bacterium]|nr:hypothetical protein [Pseudomonadota bacterium]